MTSTASSSLIDEQSTIPIARIDAQEEMYIQPLREYLETNGCKVLVNQPEQIGVAYAIASGDLFFVKDIFSKPEQQGVKRLGIVFNSSLSDAQKIANQHTKIVVVDPVHLLPNDVIEIFSFFFAERSIIVDKRRTVHEPVGAFAPTPVISPQQSTEQTVNDYDIKDQLQTQSSKSIDKHSLVEKNDATRVSSIITDVFGEQKPQGEVKKQKTVHYRKKVKKSLGLFLAFIFLIFIFPCIWYATSVSIVVASFAAEVSRLKYSDITGAKRFDAIGTYWLYQGRLSFGLVSFPLRIVNLTNTVRGQERLLSFLSDTSSALSETIAVSSTTKDTVRQLLMSQQTEGVTQPASSLETIRISVETIMESMGLAEAELATLIRDKTFPFFIPFVLDPAKKGETMLVSLRAILIYIDNLITLYPQIAGFREPKTYLVLLQNSNELRTTGGFIGSVGLAKFDSGMLSDFTIQDVYAVDGQLKGHVDPPVPLRELLAQEHWYLRDSNWDPDFKESGERAAWFYEKETGVTVDGVIAINVPVVVELLKATGPILLPDYNDRISADNFFGKSLYYTQNNSFAGSTQKSDFLGTLSRAIVTNITSDTHNNPLTIFRAIASGLASRDILFTFTDPDIQQLVEHFGWAGRVFTGNGCVNGITQSCIFDPFGVFEENVSVSKVNYFIKRTTKRDVVISQDGNISETFTLNFRNTDSVQASGSAFGVGGTYTSYVRFFMMPDVEVGSVTLDGTSIPSRNPKVKIHPPIPYIETATISANVKGIGVAVSIPPGENHFITIVMNHVAPIQFNHGIGVFDLLYYKHPGVSDEVNQTSIHFPIQWKVENVRGAGDSVAAFLSPGGGVVDSFIAKEGQLEYNSTVLQDQQIHLTITQ
jgi:hypothetical protein